MIDKTLTEKKTSFNRALFSKITKKSNVENLFGFTAIKHILECFTLCSTVWTSYRKTYVLKIFSLCLYVIVTQ